MLSKAAIRRLRDLREKKNREAAGVFVVEGGKVVAELLAAGALSEVFATRAWLEKNTVPPGVAAVEISAGEMARASHLPTPSDVLATGQMRRPVLRDGDLSRGLTLALDGIQDPGNVGTLLRVADWFGLDRVLLSEDCAGLFSQKVVNASMGSFARVNAFRVPLAAALSADNLPPVIGCDLRGENVRSIGAPADAVIVIGSEGRGISPEVRGRVTRFVTIPRFGGAESLNAAVAAAIVCDRLRNP
ncbi:MAG: RNA methyltransferase [Opitutaceae bacterium]|jgi:TrmH family RNA methyltransferase|nr:RNA methyltransferase [Opitutaceae bacterium]